MLAQFKEITLDANQTTAATALMLRVAHVDGCRTAEEVALIRAFYDASRAADWPDFESLSANTRYAMTDFPEPGQRDLVVASCLLVAYADGSLTADELASVRELASDIGMPPARVDELLALVKEHMLARLALLPDAASVAAVAHELG